MTQATEALTTGPGRSRTGRIAAPLALAGVAAAGTLALHLRDPHQQGAWGLCPFHAITGLWCPGCGSLRAVNDLTNGDLLGALSSNLVLVLALPLVALWWGRWLHTEWTGRRRPATGLATSTVFLLVVPVLVFAVVRNLPLGSWLAP